MLLKERRFATERFVNALAKYCDESVRPLIYDLALAMLAEELDILMEGYASMDLIESNEEPFKPSYAWAEQI